MKKKTQKEKKTVTTGRIYISATFNNTIVTLTDQQGTPFLIGSCGQNGFSGTRKSTPYAATVTVQNALQKAMDNHSLSAVSIYMRGIGPGRDASLRAIRASGLGINQIIDITPIPHNGVRPPKPKRG